MFVCFRSFLRVSGSKISVASSWQPDFLAAHAMHIGTPIHAKHTASAPSFGWRKPFFYSRSAAVLCVAANTFSIFQRGCSTWDFTGVRIDDEKRAKSWMPRESENVCFALYHPTKSETLRFSTTHAVNADTNFTAFSIFVHYQFDRWSNHIVIQRISQKASEFLWKHIVCCTRRKSLFRRLSK